MARRDQQLKTLQPRGYCSKAGYQRLHHILDMSRALYNAALQERRDAYRHRKKQVSYADQQNQLTLISRTAGYRKIDNRAGERLESHPLEAGQVLQVLLP